MAADSLPGRLWRRAEARGRHWARRRQGLDLLPTVLAARRIYILPTRSGLGLAVLLLAMLVAGLNYGNSLVLLLCFTLAGFAIVGLYQCHRRLLGLTVRAIELQPACAGGSVGVAMQLDTATGLDAAEYQLRLPAPESQTVTAAGHGAPQAPRITLTCPVTARGRWLLPPLHLSCSAPGGLFRSWVWLHVDAATLVYPRPAGTLPFPVAPGEERGGDTAAGNEEWVTLRPFRSGDSPRQVAWKAYARGAPLLVKEYRGQRGRQHEFDYGQLVGLGMEARLSQLAAWIIAAERQGDAYGLILPGRRIAAGSGAAHHHACLAALALHGLRDTGAAP